MFDDGFAPSHDLGVARYALGHFLLHFFRSQPGDGAILFIARTLGFEWAAFAPARPVIVNGAAFFVRGKTIGELLTSRTDVTVLPGIILKALFAIEAARRICAGHGLGHVGLYSNGVAG